jgi:hypothetical protein
MPDTIKLDPKATADRLRPLLAKEPPAPPAEDQRKLAFLEEVCKLLGIEANALNVSHIANLMAKAGIEQHVVDDYPKALNGKDSRGRIIPMVWNTGHANAGNSVIFESEEDEKEFKEGDAVIATEYGLAPRRPAPPVPAKDPAAAA